MVDTIEKRIDVPVWGEGAEEGKEYTPAKPIFREDTEDKITDTDLETAYTQTEWKVTIWNNKQERNRQISSSTQYTINQLNRSEEVKKGIEESYANIDNTIKNSKNEKWIPGFLGKIMNKILGS